MKVIGSIQSERCHRGWARIPQLVPARGWLGVLLLLVGLTSPASSSAAGVPVLEFLQPTNNSVYSTRDEIPIVLRAYAPDDVFLTAELLANRAVFATASYCCWGCPCFHPLPGDETILQIPVPHELGIPPARTWRGWTNVHAGEYLLVARATGESGTMIESAPVRVTVLD